MACTCVWPRMLPDVRKQHPSWTLKVLIWEENSILVNENNMLNTVPCSVSFYFSRVLNVKEAHDLCTLVFG